MSTFLVECPNCQCRIPVESDTMRAVVGSAPQVWSEPVWRVHMYTQIVPYTTQMIGCGDANCKCNDPEPAA